jgi:hypothetical protein
MAAWEQYRLETHNRLRQEKTPDLFPHPQNASVPFNATQLFSGMSP